MMTTTRQPHPFCLQSRGMAAVLAAAALGLAGCAAVPPQPLTVPDASVSALADPPLTTAARSSATPLHETARAEASKPSVPAPELGLDGKLPDVLVPDRSDLWERVRQGYAIPDLENDLVTKWEAWYGSRPEYVQRMTERGGRYLFHIVEEIERRGLPMDLALLPFIESAFNPQAMSRARASGMWQFMPATGKDFELRQNLFRDDRRDVLASTRAALDYLQRLHARFGDWHLALAAYNWGQGNVQRAVDRNRKAGLSTAYTALRMPDETRNYVPKLQAVKNIIARPATFGLQLPPLENHPYFLSVPIERDIDVALAARLAGLTLAEFQALNPQMNKPVILAAGTPLVLLPYDNASQFLTNLRQHEGALASWTAWVAPRNIHPSEASRAVGMAESQLREVNRIPPRMLIKKGSTLLVPRTAAAGIDVAEHIADNARLALAPEARPTRRVSVKARKGDTVASVARRHKLSPQLVARWNNKASGAAVFKAGQQVVLHLPPRPKAAATRTAAARPKAATARAGDASPRRTAATAARQRPADSADTRRQRVAGEPRPRGG